LKRPFIPHGTLDWYTSYPNWNFRPASSSLFGGRRNVNAKGNASRGAISFGFVPYSFQIYIIAASQAHGFHLALFAGYTCLYATDLKEAFVRKLQGSLSSM
jgi:hypothetical protein